MIKTRGDFTTETDDATKFISIWALDLFSTVALIINKNITMCNTSHLFCMIFYYTFIYFKKEICHIHEKKKFADCYLFLEKLIKMDACCCCNVPFKKKNEDSKEWAFLQSLNVVKVLQKL